jgi:catechol 2,3-dioxygenase-like lactoylglutathione lyase family enzyme
MPHEFVGERDRHGRMEILASRMLIRPADYQRSLTFYRDELGLAIARDYGAGTVFYAGQSLIELAGHGNPCAGGTMWLQVRDVYATENELTRRDVPITREARQESWGLHELHVTDPDGVLLIFVQVPENHPLRRDNRR